MPTKPFLAVRVFGTQIGICHPRDPKSYQHTFLLPIYSVGHPTLDGGSSSFAIASLWENMPGNVLRLHPPIYHIDGTRFYVRTYPYLRVWFDDDCTTLDPRPDGDQLGPYLFETSGFDNMCKTVAKNARFSSKHREALLARWHSSGGEEEVGDTWSSFSGTAKHPQGPFACVYDFLPFPDFHQQLVFDSDAIFQQLAVYYQFINDYKQSRTPWRTVGWILPAREHFAQQGIPSSHRFKGIPLVKRDWDRSNDELLSTAFPHDGEPVVGPAKPDDGIIDDWGMDWDDPFPRVIHIPDPAPPRTLSGGKVVAIDMFDVVFDREAAIVAALTRLLPSATVQVYQMECLVRRFMEHEALSIREMPQASYVEITSCNRVCIQTS
ncbi:hypothetical protein OF83DRAFT_1097822 [Amylostereum chailletii]|nr:hypothetical protein OF83DRAFT_1097822 [Amylostereum chailletii]